MTTYRVRFDYVFEMTASFTPLYIEADNLVRAAEKAGECLEQDAISHMASIGIETPIIRGKQCLR